MLRRRASGSRILWWATAHLVGNYQDTPIVEWWNGDGDRVVQQRAQGCRRARASGKFLGQVAFLGQHDTATGVGERAAVFQQCGERRDGPRRHELIAAPLARLPYQFFGPPMHWAHIVQAERRDNFVLEA